MENLEKSKGANKGSLILDILKLMITVYFNYLLKVKEFDKKTTKSKQFFSRILISIMILLTLFISCWISILGLMYWSIFLISRDLHLSVAIILGINVLLIIITELLNYY